MIRRVLRLCSVALMLSAPVSMAIAQRVAPPAPIPVDDIDSTTPDPATPVSRPVGIQSAGRGQVARSAVGRVGQRQTRSQATRAIVPTARIANRLQTRVQSRLRTRIDPMFDTQMGSTSPYAIAEQETRGRAVLPAPSRPIRRPRQR